MGERLYLDWPVSLAYNLQLDPLPALVQHYLSLHSNHSPGLLGWLIFLLLRQRKNLFVRNRQETAIQCLCEVSIIAADGVVYCDKVGPCWKGTLDHYFRESR